MIFEKTVDISELIKLYIGDDYTLSYLSEKYNVSNKTLSRVLNKHGIQKSAQIKHNIDHSAFSIVTTSTAYWAGFIAADGNIYKNNKGFKVKLASKDESHLYKLCNILERDCNLYRYVEWLDGKRYNTSTLMVQSSKIVLDLKKYYNITSNKTLTLISPKIEKYTSHYIRGFMDGDGCIMNGKRFRLHFVSSSKNILFWIREQLNANSKYKSKARVRKRKDKNFYELEFTGNIAKSFLDWIYNDSTDNNRLDRKYIKFKTI